MTTTLSKNKYQLIKVKNAFIALLLMTTSFASFSQVSNYSFSAFTGTYTDLVAPTNTSLSATETNAVSTLVPIGFTFYFNSIAYQNLKISSNGFIVFGNGGTSGQANDLAITGTNKRPGLAPFWDKMACTQGVHYQVNGTAPNRTLTIEWSNMKWNQNAPNPVLSYQVIMYETTNVIDFIYRRDPQAIQGAANAGASIGLMGAAATDFLSVQDVSASPAISSTVSENGINTKPINNQVFRFTPANPIKPTIFQTATATDCINGAEIDLVGGTPPADVTWYWQTTANGTSTADPYIGSKFVLTNGFVYANSFNSVLNLWSFYTDSLEITNIPTAPTPGVPTAGANPACFDNGTDLTMASPMAGYVNYWQGTSSTTYNTTADALTPLHVNTSGTYYVRTYETATQCWSATNSVTIVVSTVIPLPPTYIENPYYFCSTETTMPIEVNVPVDMELVTCSTTNTITGYDDDNLTATITNFSCPLGEIVSANLDAEFFDSYCFDEWYSYDLSINGNVISTNSCDITNFDLMPYLPLTNISATVHDDDGFSDDIDFTLTVTFAYNQPSAIQAPYSVEWYDAATSGNLLGTTTSIDALGTSVLPTAINGTYNFYTATRLGGCLSTIEAVEVNVADVNVEIIAQGVSCNNGEDGTFTIPTTYCGNAPFMYSIDGTANVATIPTDLTVGQHTIVITDANGDLSATYTITITDALAPSNQVINSYNFDQADISWLANGSETSWNVEWGAPGFTPGTGTEIGAAIATDTNYVITGLDGATEYDIYISANCGGTSTPGSWIDLNVTTPCDPYPIPFQETFEDNSASRDCWTNEFIDGNAPWTYEEGSSDVVLNAYEGVLNARFVSEFNYGTPITNLKSPAIATNGQDSIALVFAYAQPDYFGDQNTTRVLVRENNSAPWVEIANFTADQSSWKVDTLFIPTSSATIEIAFEGTNSFGYENVIDDVNVFPCTVTPSTDGTMDLCRLDGQIDLNSIITLGETYGKWSFPPNTSLITNGSMIDLALLPNGTFDFYYIIETPCASDTAIATITVHPASSAGTNGQVDVCKNQPFNLLAGLSGIIDLGGTWYNPSNTALPSGQITSGSLPGQFNYYYVTNNGFCPNDTANVIVNISASCDWSGLEELNADAITVYPNPSTGLFYIANTDASQNFNYQVVDLNGRIIVESKVEINGSTTIEVDLTKVETGIYMIRLYNTYGSKLVRVVKQ